jgi:hemoglobin
MNAIKDRDDIFKLVNTFYAKVRQDDTIGPVFNGIIAEGEWPAHLQKLTDFWETNLFGKLVYKGSPTAAHVGVDRFTGNQISQLHFHRWLMLWFETVDGLFDGELAERAKDGARRMATRQFMAIARNR